MAGKGKMVTGGLATKQKGKKATTRVQTKSEVNKTVARGNKAKLDIIPMEADLAENVRPNAGGPSQKVTHASAAKDFSAMERNEGDPFASKRGRQVDMSPYEPTKRDIDRGAAEDPRAFKGPDAPYGRATPKQQGAFREADAQVRASTALGDRKGAEKARGKMNVLGQYPGVSSGVSHSCFGSNCPNEVTPSESVLCTDCESRDSSKIQIGAVSGAAASRSRTREQKSA